MNNNTLLIFLDDGQKQVMSFPESVTEDIALKHFEDIHPTLNARIKKHFFFLEDTTSLDVYRKHYFLDEDGKLDMNMRSAFVEDKVLEIKKKRDILLARLDIPFFKALEEDNEKLKQHITKLKNFLRSLPENLRFSEIEKEVDIAKYDPFNNIFHVGVVHGGSGYTKPPSVTVDSPVTQSIFGFRTEVTASIRDGQVVGVDVINPGCGYRFVPNIDVDPPEDGDLAVLGCWYPENTMIDQEEFAKNSENHYRSHS